MNDEHCRPDWQGRGSMNNKLHDLLNHVTLASNAVIEMRDNPDYQHLGPVALERLWVDLRELSAMIVMAVAVHDYQLTQKETP